MNTHWNGSMASLRHIPFIDNGIRVRLMGHQQGWLISGHSKLAHHDVGLRLCGVMQSTKHREGSNHVNSQHPINQRVTMQQRVITAIKETQTVAASERSWFGREAHELVSRPLLWTEILCRNQSAHWRYRCSSDAYVSKRMVSKVMIPRRAR